MRPAYQFNFIGELELPWRDSGVAAQIAVQREQTAVEAGCARLLEDTGGRCFRIDWVVALRRARGIHKGVGRPVEGAGLREPNSVAVMGARSHHRKAADKRTATAGFCSLPRSIAEPFRRS